MTSNDISLFDLGHNSRSKVTDVEVSAFSECFLLSFISLYTYRYNIGRWDFVWAVKITSLPGQGRYIDYLLKLLYGQVKLNTNMLDTAHIHTHTNQTKLVRTQTHTTQLRAV